MQGDVGPFLSGADRPAVGGFQVTWELCVPGAARLAHAKTEFNGTGALLTYIGLVPAVS
jgi:hypothetical protein